MAEQNVAHGPLYGAWRAILALRSGDHNRATRFAAEAVESIDRTQQEWQRADLRRWLSVVPRTTGDLYPERRMLFGAMQIYALKGIHGYDTEVDRRLAELDQTGER